MKRTEGSAPFPLAWRLTRSAVVAVSFAGLVMFLAVTLVGCGGVQIKPDSPLPRPLIQTLPTRVGLVIPGDMRNFTHSETRWGVEWTIALGDGHTHLMREVFKDSFDQVQEFKDVDEARAAPEIKAIFEPRIEQYSFVTARETGGRYYAVTIRYRINLYTPSGEKADSLTLTGYGNALAKGMTSGKPLEQASLAAMRDAAAKFLVQFPEQPAGEKLARNEPIIVEHVTATADAGGIDTVPIEESAAEVEPPAPSGPGTQPASAPPATDAPPPKAS
jgi:hypothetical protein